MKTLKQSAAGLLRPGALALSASFLGLLALEQIQAYPIGTTTFKDDSPFAGASTNAILVSTDGLLTVAAWADLNATVPANLYQWWWILGVDSGIGNGALLDGQESITLQFDNSVGCSHISFLYTGNQGDPGTPSTISISGFASDPGAYATTHQAPRISNLNYENGTLTFGYLYEPGNDYGQLLFANPAASRGQRLKITYGGTSWGAALFRVDTQELFGGPILQPVSVRQDFTNAFTTTDGQLTVRGYSDAAATLSANLGTYVDQCFGVVGGNSGALDLNESVTLQFAPGIGLSRLETVYSSGLVTISGFAADPAFTDNLNGSFSASYADGVLTFYPFDGGRHAYFFKNRAASAGRTLRVNVDANYSFTIAGVGYDKLETLMANDVPSAASPTCSTPDGALVLAAYADTPGSVPANLYENVDWFGVAGGAANENKEAIDGTESLNLQFASGMGLTALGSRYTGGRILISGFGSDPGFHDPSGTATGVSYSAGTISYTFNAWRSPEMVVQFMKPAASAGRTLSLHTDGTANSQIALTRISYGRAPLDVTLSIVKSGDSVVLTWPSGTLQQSTNPVSFYTDVSGVSSPFTNVISAEPRFFRVKVQ